MPLNEAFALFIGCIDCIERARKQCVRYVSRWPEADQDRPPKFFLSRHAALRQFDRNLIAFKGLKDGTKTAIREARLCCLTL